MTTCLVCDSDSASRSITEQCLRSYNVQVQSAGLLADLKPRLLHNRVDAILIEAMLKDGDGLQFCSVIRSVVDVPLLVVSKQNDGVSRVLGLEWGADDYVGKPFDSRELLARIRAVIRRRSGDLSTTTTARYGWGTQVSTPQRATIRVGQECIGIDWLDRKVCHPSGQVVALSASEARLLVALTDNAGALLSRADLIGLTGAPSEIQDRAIDLTVSRLRAKLGDKPSRPHIIATIRGMGYRFLAHVDRVGSFPATISRPMGPRSQILGNVLTASTQSRSVLHHA